MEKTSTADSFLDEDISTFTAANFFLKKTGIEGGYVTCEVDLKFCNSVALATGLRGRIRIAQICPHTRTNEIDKILEQVPVSKDIGTRAVAVKIFHDPFREYGTMEKGVVEFLGTPTTTTLAFYQLSSALVSKYIGYSLGGDKDEYGTERTPPVASIIYERAEGQTISELVEKEQNMPSSQKFSMLAQATAALAYVHKQRCTHNDAHSENFIWNSEQNTIKLIDFSESDYAEYGEQDETANKKADIESQKFQFVPFDVLFGATGSAEKKYLEEQNLTMIEAASSEEEPDSESENPDELDLFDENQQSSTSSKEDSKSGDEGQPEYSERESDIENTDIATEITNPTPESESESENTVENFIEKKSCNDGTDSYYESELSGTDGNENQEYSNDIRYSEEDTSTFYALNSEIGVDSEIEADKSFVHIVSSDSDFVDFSKKSLLFHLVAGFSIYPHYKSFMSPRIKHKGCTNILEYLNMFLSEDFQFSEKELKVMRMILLLQYKTDLSFASFSYLWSLLATGMTDIEEITKCASKDLPEEEYAKISKIVAQYCQNQISQDTLETLKNESILPGTANTEIVKEEGK